MWENQYLPEGSLRLLDEVIEAKSSPSALEAAMRQGRIIEGIAMLCDGALNLWVDLGCMKGVIYRDEVGYTSDGEPLKDIAIISRVGKPVAVLVTAISTNDKGEPYAILSRKKAQREALEEYLYTLKAGDIIPAKVTHLEHFGAFVDVGCGVASLLSIDSISVSRISHPRDRFYVGMPIKAVVKSVDRESGRIYVTHKELLGTWEENASHFTVGQTVMGIVRSIEDYGVFIELSPNLAGLAEYRSDIHVGDGVAVYIKNIIPERMKIKLVIIDACKAEPSRSKIDYYVAPECCHIDLWQYSPSGTGKVIESHFS